MPEGCWGVFSAPHSPSCMVKCAGTPWCCLQWVSICKTKQKYLFEVNLRVSTVFCVQNNKKIIIQVDVLIFT